MFDTLGKFPGESFDMFVDGLNVVL